MYKKEMKYYENDFEFQWVYQGFKNIFWFIDIQIFIQGINAQITSIQCLKHMLNNI